MDTRTIALTDYFQVVLKSGLRSHWESLSIGIRSKYAFVNNSEGWSFAAALGTGASGTGTHYYGDLLGSYKAASWEPYTTLRVVHVENDDLEFEDSETGQVSLTIPGSEYDYGQFILGVRYWFAPHWLFSLEASTLFASSVLDVTLVSGSLGYRF